MDLKRGSRQKKKNNVSTTARATTTVRHNEPKRKTRLTLCVNVCGYLLVVDVVRAATFFFLVYSLFKIVKKCIFVDQ